MAFPGLHPFSTSRLSNRPRLIDMKLKAEGVIRGKSGIHHSPSHAEAAQAVMRVFR